MGTGLVTNESHLIYDIEMWLMQFRKQAKKRSLIIKCHPLVAVKMREGKVKSFIFQLKYFMRLKFADDDKIRPGRFKFFSAKTGDELTKLVD